MSKQVHLSLADINGRLVFQQKYSPGERIFVDGSDKVAGLYILKLNVEGRQFVKKLLVKSN